MKAKAVRAAPVRAAPVAREESAAEWVPLDSVKPSPKNPKEKPEDLGPWVESLREFGFAAPLLCRRETRELVGGHATLEAARALGMEKVLVRFLDLDEDKATRLSIVITQLERARKWDYGLLSTLLHDIDARETGLIGFSDPELAKLMGENYKSEVEELAVSTIGARFFLSASGPLAAEADFLARLRALIGSVPGVDVEITTSEI